MYEVKEKMSEDLHNCILSNILQKYPTKESAKNS